MTDTQLGYGGSLFDRAPNPLTDSGTWDGGDIIAPDVQRYAEKLPTKVSVLIDCQECGHVVVDVTDVVVVSKLEYSLLIHADSGIRYELFNTALIAHVIRHHGFNADGSRDHGDGTQGVLPLQ